ncbi:hypothetical protein HHE03_02050 [Helicobacter heilmannii]|nr:hypothetical protein HHE014_01590 [Helicobacter heilmannii]CRF48634.1 hypothetical protein HHE03_02050 [Helicobacter heilmannii]
MLWASNAVSVFFALFFLLSFKRAGAHGLLVILMFGALVYYFLYKPPIRLSKECKWLAGAFVLMFLSVLPSLFIQSDLESWRYNLPTLEMPLLYVFGAVALVCLSGANLTLKQSLIFTSMAIACVLNGGIALVQRVFLSVGRVDGSSSIMAFVVLTSMAVFGCYIHALHTHKRLEKILFSAALLLGFVVVLFSGTRTAMLAFALGFLALSVLVLYLQKSWRALPFMLAIALSFVAMFGIDYTLEHEGVLKTPRNAYENFSHDLQLYAQKNPNTSTGLRIARWKVAIAIARLSPIFGMSPSTKCARLPEILALAHSYRKADEIDCGEKYENEILNTLARRGLVGVAVLLLFWGVVGRFFWQNLRVAPEISLFGLGMLVFYVVFAMGFDPFSFFTEGSFFIGMVVMATLVTSQRNLVIL